ncbi:MAG: hypothetical protein IT384_09185 [Deltaproteobacteria bacterium]|nr:hypothetical protein [Deltaproteobacteria bacterium]
MISTKFLACLFSLGLLAACSETEECKKLNDLRGQHDRLLTETRSKAALLDRLKSRAEAAEVKANKTLEALGLDLDESKITDRLTVRVAAIPTATISVGYTPLAPSESGHPTRERMWEVSFDAKNVEQAFDLLAKVVEVPPLVRVASFIKDRGKRRWRAQLLVQPVERIPVEPKPVLVPTLDDPGTIPSQLGFCGAGKIRRAIGEIRAQLSELRPKAERTTVLLPTVATFDGLGRRAEMAEKTETESRRLMQIMAVRADAAKVEIKAVGFETPLVVLEVWGKQPELARLEKQLAPMASRLKKLDPAPPGVIRLGLPNPVAEKNKPPQPRAGGAMPEAPHGP